MQWIENWNLNAKIENDKKIQNQKLYSKVSNVNFMKLQLLLVRHVNCHYLKCEFFFHLSWRKYTLTPYY